ncbi:glutathione S-transferase family protein [Bartonella sp. DGB2]|uniref:glutathione S-transferase family protein n=1 Tax=Bartonella sp. DGB2 TaxID=3388426 RepID=UPI00398FE019
MLTLFHYPMSSPSRFIRLLLHEYDLHAHLLEEYEWARRREFLALNPAGHLPVLLAEREVPLAGALVIYEYLDETRGVLRQEQRLFSENPLERAEVRRLVDWFLYKFESEVTRPIVRERIYKREMPLAIGGGAPDSQILRHARANIRPHLKYLNWLAASRDWLAGKRLSYADFAAAAALSVLDFMGEVEWNDYNALREWYMRLKSRPSFRPLLSDRIRGLAPSNHYTDLDF